ncbi:zf-HC2 domain-containing protein [Arthrobacter sp. 35W]|uniref:zf-HC2 domain-containing protein n=1 Tax=Arthrobacter sp. 35W TaxID=1132441 RepID=UPI0003F53933|nr:zf-HC2 domain-containing protein [Arthrobacter sp. 35W]
MNTDPADHAALQHLVGAYILGGLESQERVLFEQHLALCPACTGEVDSLQSLSGFLDAIPAESAIALASPGTPSGRATAADGGSSDRDGAQRPVEAAGVGNLLDKLAARRRRSHWRAAALVSGVAAAFLAIGLVAGPVLTGPPKPEESYTISATSGPQVQLGLLKKAWGTELALDGTSLPASGILSLWVKDTSGNYDRAASWNATAAGKANVTGATPVPIEDMASIEIRDASGQKIAVLSRTTGS